MNVDDLGWKIPVTPLAWETMDFLNEFLALRESATAANGLVSVEVDGTSDLTGLKLDPRAMRLPATELAEAIKEAFGRAREAAQQRATQAIPEVLKQDPLELNDLMEKVRADTQADMNELLSTVNGLTSRLDRLMQQ
ncbi:YbaB/EbfC family nucleoid-associated protein [Nonomuraea muscovyensis]|uniref:DNA-binding protein YbaB n=1 Tax=Nonomuraea muscovyensis TaxID=1124761 RepID=A0A7X0C0C0_9ACTN|nr:YbaB/EbfC family nucleoid-associated protein [Nonomuraea muscovyensis]MBB6344786.1 DNA-binding protein YbaB [Nonomuraea muscovyensis]